MSRDKRPTFRENASSPEYVLAGGHRLRQLTATEVVFTITTEADESSVEGHFSTDEPELDRQNERDIIARLQAGDDSAWCGVIVTATWTSPSGVVYKDDDSIWGCSLDDSYTEAVVASTHGMHHEALAALNERLASIVESAALLASELKLPRRKPYRR